MIMLTITFHFVGYLSGSPSPLGFSPVNEFIYNLGSGYIYGIISLVIIYIIWSLIEKK